MIRDKAALTVFVSLVLLVSVIGCAPRAGIPGGDSESALISECISSCQSTLAQGKNLDAGPCLLNPMSNKGWVCDVAHKPRQEIDDLPEHQCSEYQGHFIEVTPECKFIRAI